MEPPNLEWQICIWGITLLLIIALLFFWGRRIALPFQQPVFPSLVFFLVWLYYLILLLCVPQNSILSKRLGLLFPRYPLITHFAAGMFLSACLLGSIPAWRCVNHATLKELSPMRQSIELQSKFERREHKGNSIRVKKMEALIRELALGVASLGHTATDHPVMLVFHRRRVMRLRSVIERFLKLFAQWPHTLNHALHLINVPQLIAFANQSSLDILRVATHELSRDAKTVLLDGLQKNGKTLRKSVSRQEWVRELLVGTSGADLLTVKSVLDGGGDYQSLRKLVFEDITSVALRTAVLDHFQTEVVNVLGSPERIQSEKSILRKVLSDIDDTLFSSGGKFPHGIDRRFPRHAVYPGLLQFYMELDTQWKLKNVLPKNMVRAQDYSNLNAKFCNLIFVSARPHIYKDVSERFTYQLFNHLLDHGLLHEMPTLMPGRLQSSLKGICGARCHSRRAWRAVCEEKVANIRRCTLLYPSYTLLFFGDNGQGDLMAAELALQESPPLILIAFINEVKPRRESLSIFQDMPALEQESRWTELGIIWMRNPVEGAVQAVHREILSPESLFRICSSAVDDMEALALRYPHFPDWRDRFSELNDALLEARRIRPDVQLIDAESLRCEVQCCIDLQIGSLSEDNLVSFLPRRESMTRRRA